MRLSGPDSLGAEYKVKYWFDCSRVGPGKARHRVLESVFEHLHEAGIEPARERRDLVMNQVTAPPSAQARAVRYVRRPRIAAIHSGAYQAVQPFGTGRVSYRPSFSPSARHRCVYAA